MVVAQVEILKYNKNLLKWLYLWPDKNVHWYHPKDLLHWITTLPFIIPILLDIYMSFEEPDFEFQDITENCIEIATIVTAAYMVIIFKAKKSKILLLVEKLEKLQIYHQPGTPDFLTDAEEFTMKLTKYFFYFVFCSNPLYAIIPLWNVSKCRNHRALIAQRNSTTHFGALDTFPCGLDFKSRFPYDIMTNGYHYWLWEALEYYCSVATTVCGVVLTTFMCSVLIYFIAEIRNLKVQINDICKPQNDFKFAYERMIFTVEYHVNIIECTALMNDAFGSVLLMHFMITGVAISVLAVNILISPLRYSAEIFGWILILYLPSTFGQRLKDESEDIMHVAFNSEWYNTPVPIQKGILFIIAASRRTLCLRSMNYAVFCHNTFMMVMKSAYSFFTLMIRK